MQSDFQKTGRLYRHIDFYHVTRFGNYWDYKATTQQWRYPKHAKASYCQANGLDPKQVKAFWRKPE